MRGLPEVIADGAECRRGPANPVGLRPGGLSLPAPLVSLGCLRPHDLPAIQFAMENFPNRRRRPGLRAPLLGPRGQEPSSLSRLAMTEVRTPPPRVGKIRLM